MARSDGMCVVHLVWAPLGAGMLARFIDGYRRHPAGQDHRLAVILNGFSGPRDPRLAEVEAVLDGLEVERVSTPRPVLDLCAYRLAAARLEGHTLCLVNSYSCPLADEWLARLARPLLDGSAALTGTGGSYESAYTAAPFWLRHRRRREFLPFPNPHLRTNGFAIDRQLFLELEWPALESKVAAWSFESGRRSISRQVWERGLEVVVVGRDGVAYAPERWRESATFRSGEQRNLLISDNRTRQYENADPGFRNRLEEMAWGAPT